jgi:5-methylcytosine-specific restriction protein A
MALAPPRYCTHPRCPKKAVAEGRCEDHRRPSAHQRHYTYRWTKYAAAWLLVFPWCGQRRDGAFYPEHSACVRRGERVRAEVVDHIVPLSAGGSVFDPVNHQSLCVRCNTLKG